MPKWIFWVGIFLLVDGAIDLYALDFWQKRFPHIHVRKIALTESAVGLALVGLYFALR